MPTQLVLINPPELRGFTNERTFSGGIGVSRKLKPFERDDLVLPPIDMLYTAAVAEQAGAHVHIVDLLLHRLHDEEALAHTVAAVPTTGEPVWVGVRLSIPSLPQDLAFANALKERLPAARLFVFGSVIMTTLDHWVRECYADFILYGEPEAVIGPLLTAEAPARVPGVICPARHVPLAAGALYDGAVNTPRYAGWVKADHLNDLPRPAWHLLDMKRYAPGGDVTQLGVYLQASRGCPIGCTMCPYMLLEGKPWRSNAIDLVVDEIQHLNETYGIYRVRFRDPNFGFNRRYAKELCEAIIRRGVRLEATVETSVEVFDEETLRTMRQAGIRTITTGIETNDADCMASIGQKIAVNDKLRERLDFCHKLGFHIYGTFCLGTPEESWDTVRRTWQFANELDVESGFTVMTPFPGTPMYWRALQEGLLAKEMRYTDWNSYTSTMRTRFLTTRDLDMARLWSRLETILPYRGRRAKEQGAGAVARFYGKHLAHFAVRQWCRLYVAWRRSTAPTTRGAAPRTAHNAEN